MLGDERRGVTNLCSVADQGQQNERHKLPRDVAGRGETVNGRDEEFGGN